MKGEFIILVVCAAFVHISLVETSPATAVISKKTIDDFEFIRLRQRASFLGIQNIIECIFPQNLEDYLVKGGLSDGESNGGNQTEEEKCLYRLLAYGNGVIADTMSVATVLDPEIFPAIMSAHAPTVNGLTNLFTDVCTALKLAARNHSSAAAAQIQALNNKQAALAAGFNIPYFAAIRAGKKFRPEMETLGDKSERQATEKIVKAFIDTFDTIQEFGSKGGLEGAIEEISPMFDTRRKRIISANCDSLQAKYDFAEAVYTSSQIIQCADQNPTVTVPSGNEDFAATAALEAEKGISSVFDTILHFENQNLSPKYSYETASNETSAAYISAVHAALNAILKINSECSPIVEAAKATSEFKIKKMVDDFYKNFTPRTSESEIQILEEGFTQKLSELFDDLFDVGQQCIQQPAPTTPPPMNRRPGLLNLGIPSLQLQTSPSLLGLNLNVNLKNLLGLIDIFQKKSFTNARKPITNFFNDLRDIIANPVSGILAKGKIAAPLMNVRTGISASANDMLESGYEAIITIVKVSGKSDTDIAEALAEIEICRQQSRLGLENGIGVLFRYLTAIKQDVPQDDPSEFIEAGRVATTTAYSTALRNIFRGFEFAITNTTSVAEQEALSLLLKAVDAIYRAIQEAQSNSCEFLENFTDTNETITQNLLPVNSQFHDEIRRSPHYNVKDEPALSRIRYESIAHTNALVADILGRIRTRAAANCPESEANGNDDFPPITAGHDHASSELAKVISSYFSALAIISGESTDNIADPPAKTTTTRIAVTRTIEY